MEYFRYLNDAGRDEWLTWLKRLKHDSTLPAPSHLLTDSKFSNLPEAQISAPSGGWESKYEMAGDLSPLVEELERLNLPAASWGGIWDALAIKYFDDICPRNSEGKRRVGEIERFYFDPKYTRYYKHRTAANIFFRRSYGSSALLFLYGPPKVCSDFEIRIGSYPSWVSAPAVGQAAFKLYWDEKRSAHVRGSMNMDKPGLLGHFIGVLAQLERTYDIAGMNGDALLSLLPTSFKPRN